MHVRTRSLSLEAVGTVGAVSARLSVCGDIRIKTQVKTIPRWVQRLERKSGEVEDADGQTADVRTPRNLPAPHLLVV